MKKILKNLNIIAEEGGRFVPVRGDICIENNRIVSVGKIPEDFAVAVPQENIEDFGFKYLAFPGLFNAHTHISMGLLRNIADGLPLMEWLQTKIWPVEEQLTSDDIYYGALLGISELIRSGCTSYRDMYYMEDRVAEATVLSGIRGSLAQGMIIQNDEHFAKIDISGQIYKKCHGSGNGRVRIEIAPHAPYTCSDDGLIRAKRLADELGTFYHIHLSESDDELRGSFERYGISPVQRLANLGVLSGSTAAAHCVKLSDEDLDILAEKGVNVLLNPSSNLKLKNGAARVRDMLLRGINIAIGTDGASSNNNVNMIEELHIAALVYDISPEEALRAATLGGALSAGYSDLGVLKAGYLADIAFLDLDASNLTPHGNLLSAIVYSAAACDVAHLMVDGSYVMKDRVILTFDEERVRRECRRIAARLLQEEDDFSDIRYEQR